MSTGLTDLVTVALSTWSLGSSLHSMHLDGHKHCQRQLLPGDRLFQGNSKSRNKIWNRLELAEDGVDVWAVDQLSQYQMQICRRVEHHRLRYLHHFRWRCLLDIYGSHPS